MCLFCMRDTRQGPAKAPLDKTVESQVEITNVYAQEDVIVDLENLTCLVKRALCAERVSQMTKTYHDIDAVTRLLEEKEKDLELAAKIGQTLLQRNKTLELQNEQLEEQLTVATEKNAQLSHEIQMKTDLLQIYTNEVDYSESEDDSLVSYGGSYINLESLHKKINWLEEENLQLRLESAQISTETSNYEEKEHFLVHDCVRQLGEVNTSVEILKDELYKKLEENQRQQEEITSLLAQIVDLQSKVKKLTIENDELHQELQAGKEAQRELTAELSELKEKYDECMAMIREFQEDAKTSRKPSLTARSAYTPLSSVFPQDSLASEIEISVKQNLMHAEGYSPKETKERNKNVMKTVKAANKTRTGFLSIPGSSMQSLRTSRRTSPTSSIIASDRDTPSSDHYHGDEESGSEAGNTRRRLGRPGIPGSNDLELALRRLSLRRQNQEFERKYVEVGGKESSGTATPLGKSPESIMSVGSFSEYSGISSSSGLGIRSYIPEKLQIVKPIEGSMTLHHWQRLATPDMASMLDTRPGIYVKGYKTLEHEEEIFSLDEFEDDGNVTTSSPYTAPSKLENTNTTLTFTNSKILHLDDNTQVTGSTGTKQSIVTCNPKLDSPLSEKATRTFSTTVGLARLLQERGISPITPPLSSDNESEKMDKEKSPTAEKVVSPLVPPPAPSPSKSGIIQRSIIMSGPRMSAAPFTSASTQSARFSLVDKLRNMGVSNVATTQTTMTTSVSTRMSSVSSTLPMPVTTEQTTSSQSGHVVSGPIAMLSGSLAFKSMRKGPIL
ncbi:trafficking kinesin-binding protein 1-like isoform X5 [Ptychodera flava]|uniref:trafficking kinesin-binding protein 1-like isoform X5 n=2 Tax=Ptychodera flava TaxID=63121 RepID=UPI00396A180D